NPAHRALADLARAGRIALLVTQNVDGLHERSGLPADCLVNIHGTDSAVECLHCRRREARAVAQRAWEEGVPVPCCPCGAPWKPATISFGQALVPEDLARALRAAAAPRRRATRHPARVRDPVRRAGGLEARRSGRVGAAGGARPRARQLTAN